MPCIFKLIVDLILGPEEQVAYIGDDALRRVG